MTYKLTTTLCLAGWLLAAAAPGFAQVTPRTAPAGSLHLAPRAFQVEAAAPEGRTLAADTTLRYYDLTRGSLFDLSLGGSVRAVGTFFTAPFDGTIDRVDFELSNAGPAPGVAGTGTLRIKLIEATEVPLNPPFSPGVDSLDVDFADLAAHGIISPGNFINQIDVSSRDFEIQDSVEYFLQLAIVDESADEALTFVFDGGSNDSTDTRYFTGPFADARTILYLDFGDPEEDGFFSLRDPSDTTFVHLNVLLELQLTDTTPPPPPPPPPPALARMQIIHNAPGVEAVDLYVGDSLVVDDLGFREATPFLDVPAGQQTIDVVAAGDATRGNPIFSTSDSLAENQVYWAMALGASEQTLDVVIEPVQSAIRDMGNADVVVAHGGIGVDSISVHILDETSAHNVVDTLAQNLGFGRFAEIAAVDTGFVNVEVAAGGMPLDVYRLAMNQGIKVSQNAAVLFTSGVLGGDPAFGLFLADSEGNVTASPVSTATEPRAVPARFVLHSNYPNPFNPTTAIRFDLDAPGFTTLAIYNLLGQQVATLVAEPLPVGSYERVFDASGLPSGPYVYRLTSGGLSQQRMLMLIK